MKKTILRDYARLAVRTGANVQKGQPVIIYAEADQYAFVRLLVAEAYRAGASKVRVDWQYQPVVKLNYKNQSLKNLSAVPLWLEEREKEFCRELPAVIRVLSEDPDGLNGINTDKMQKVRRGRYKVLKKYRDESDNKYQWTIVAVPSKEWAKKVFPGERSSAAVRLLWEAILTCARAGGALDPQEAWRLHNEEFAEKCGMLNAAKFDYLHYKSSNGTDFKCRLNPLANWLGGGEKTTGGVYFNPNIPSEEVFTSPMKGYCEGRLVSTKPLSHNGIMIDKFHIDFKDGKAVGWDAETGKEALEKIITSDEGSAMLGELALVPQSSPINETGILFYNTLFDENASCHVALGAGFTNTIIGFETMTTEKCHALGINDSMLHVDFMIGAPDLAVTGYKNGAPTPVFVDGEWAGK